MSAHKTTGIAFSAGTFALDSRESEMAYTSPVTVVPIRKLAVTQCNSTTIRKHVKIVNRPDT